MLAQLLRSRVTSQRPDTAHRSVVPRVQGHNARLRKLVNQMQTNQDVYVARALEYEAHVVRPHGGEAATLWPLTHRTGWNA